jgi:hypothetical protein
MLWGPFQNTRQATPVSELRFKDECQDTTICLHHLNNLKIIKKTNAYNGNANLENDDVQ